jgi:hypothetical protein
MTTQNHKERQMTIETLIWVGITLAVGVILCIAEPYHTRLIDAAHGRLEAKDAARKARKKSG